MKRFLAGLTVFSLLLLAVPALAAHPQPQKVAKAQAPSMEWVEEVFIDYGDGPTHAGSGPHPTTESDRYHLTQGGIRWFLGGAVEYQITGTQPISGANTAIESTVDTWNGFVTTRTFNHNDSTGQTNPCTGSPNTIQWASIDGVGGTLAVASVCRNVATKEIGGFTVTMDKDESWATDKSWDKFDVENVASHEMGHVVGLGHVNAPRDGCLTMYRYATQGEIQKRTLGLGDKLGMDVLYGTGDTDPGPGCGL